ncbi:MAG: hypothetical protein ACR2KK_22440 [Acidimicrobiales bacterium]
MKRLSVLAMAAAGLMVTGACAGGAVTRSFPLDVGKATTTTTSIPSSTTTSTTIAATTTSTSALRATTTTAGVVRNTTPTAKPTTSPRPLQPKPSEPRIIASPPGAVPESRVSIWGEGFTAEHWRTPNVPLWLAGGPSGCDFFAEADHQVTVTAGGELQGSFVVPSHGACRQSSTGEGPVLAGTYRIVYQCTACTIGEFTVTTSAPPSVGYCQDVGFTPNTDDVVADIVAYGLPCAEAEAVVRKVAKPLGPLTGAPRGEADGFTCVRTSESEGRGLPSAEYECRRGGQKITFTRL